MSEAECFKEAIELVIIDGICLGIDTAGASEQTAIIETCHAYLGKVLSSILSTPSNPLNTEPHSTTPVINSDSTLGVHYYTLDKKQAPSQALTTQFAFNA